MLTLTKTGHQISEESIISLTRWNTTHDGYSGSLEYTLDGQSYLNPVTQKEISYLHKIGIVSTLNTSKYNGSY